ncbi:MAG TPA: MmgE/PrpD family protein, partial [Candidatus Binatia bacterium]|nr:MmgE/PrpD family protein [Candidatus Binatia bacterium]
MGTTKDIADFITGAESSGIGESVTAPAKRHVIDTFGVALGGTAMALARPLSRVVARSAAGESFIWDGSGRANAADAALVNGTLAHALDFDDGGVAPTPMHPSSPVLPTVWALCEGANRSGRDA